MVGVEKLDNKKWKSEKIEEICHMCLVRKMENDIKSTLYKFTLMFLVNILFFNKYLIRKGKKKKTKVELKKKTKHVS